MHLSPRDLDKLVLHNAGFVAQKRLARGLKLNYPESVALIATQLLEFIRDGRSVSELMDLGRRFLGRNQVMAGVAEMVAEVQVEGTFPDGTKLCTVHHPIAAANGDLTLALYGSFLPLPPQLQLPLPAEGPATEACERSERSRGSPGEAGEPGAREIAAGTITINEGRQSVELSVTNLADRPIQVGSHYHFVETNPYLLFDRAKAYGRRLDIPAGTAVRFEPGETRMVQLVEIAGNRVIRGGNNLAEGPVDEAGRTRALERVVGGGF